VRLYAGTSPQFIEDSTPIQIADKLRDAFFFHPRYRPPFSDRLNGASIIAAQELFERDLIVGRLHAAGRCDSLHSHAIRQAVFRD
jgi:hypothetical protein